MDFNPNDFTSIARTFRRREMSLQDGLIWLIESHPQPNFLCFVEVGVYNGQTPRRLLETFPSLYYIGVDHWLPFEEGPGDRTTFHARASAYDAIAPYPTRARLWEGSSPLVAQNFPKGTMDAIFIDAAHSYGPVITDLASWYPALREGGLFIFHDYGYQSGVKRAVDEFLGKEPEYIGGNADLGWVVKGA